MSRISPSISLRTSHLTNRKPRGYPADEFVRAHERLAVELDDDAAGPYACRSRQTVCMHFERDASPNEDLVKLGWFKGVPVQWSHRSRPVLRRGQPIYAYSDEHGWDAPWRPVELTTLALWPCIIEFNQPNKVDG